MPRIIKDDIDFAVFINLEVVKVRAERIIYADCWEKYVAAISIYDSLAILSEVCWLTVGVGVYYDHM